MSNNYAAGSRVLMRVLLAVLFTVSGLASCGGGGSSTTVNTTPTTPATYTITASADSGGTITPSGATTVTQGASQTYTITPGLGYIIATVLVDGKTVAASTYTFTDVQANHTISVTFSAAPTYTITASAGSGGTVTPSGITTVIQGDSQSYTITPNSGNIVATLMVDGSPVATSTTYTFTNVTANHTISATFSAAAPGGIVLSLVPARTSGVAPLAVFFDATATTDTGVTTHPFHDLEYTWNFGDPVVGAAGTWAYGAQPGVSSKNSATGPVAAHVFEPVFNVGETSRTYTVSVTAFDGTNSATISTIITVQNPNEVFANSNTICIGATSTPVQGVGGCPAGAATAQQADFPTIISTHATTGKRVLLKRDDTFASSVLANIVNVGPMIIGAYGSGAKPQINMTNNTQILSFGSGNQTISDVRVMDLHFDGGNTPLSYGIGLFYSTAGVADILLFRSDFTNLYTSIGFGPEGVNAANNSNGWTNTIDKLFVVESTTTGSSNTDYSAYNAGIRVAFMGNHFDNGGYAMNPTGSHVTRWMYLNKAVISNNDLFRPGFDRHCIYVVGGAWTSGAPSSTVNGGTTYSSAFMGDGYTKNIIISDNHTTDDNSAWQIILTPVSGYDMRIKDVIIERNLQEFSNKTSIAQVIRADYVTSRNNIAISNSNNNTFWLARVDRDGLEPAHHDIWIYNNTMYKSIPSPNTDFNSLSFAYLPDTGTSNVTIRNNLGYSPGASGSAPYYDAGITNLTASNNSTSSQINSTSPTFTKTPPVVVSDFKPTCTGSTYPCAQGITVPVWSDFFRSTVPNPRDMGAVSH